MPVGGIVITGRPEDCEDIVTMLKTLDGLDVHGKDASGNIVAVLDTESSEDMERLIDRINKEVKVLNVGLTYLNTEDEAAQLADGVKLPKPFGFKKTIDIDS